MPTKALRRFADHVETACVVLASVALAYLLFTVAFNVAARIVFDASGTAVNLMIPGAIEQASYLLGIIALAALTASMKSGMIAVDIVTGRFPKPVQIVISRIWYIGILAFALAIGWLFWEETLATHGRGEETQDLRLPMFLIYGLYTLESLALAVVALREALTHAGQHAELS